MDDVIVEKPVHLNYIRSPPAGRRQTYIVNNLEKKHDSKKWSFGGFFRRQKKCADSESSSQEDLNQLRKNAVPRKKKSSKKSNEKPKKKFVDTFDHIVFLSKGNGHYGNQDSVMSDPSFTENNRRRDSTRILHNYNNIFNSLNGVGKSKDSVETSKSSHESLVKGSVAKNDSCCNGSYGSLDSTTKKRHRERTRQRRDLLHHNDCHSSSDEGSQRSTASSLIRIKSDSDSLNGKTTRDGYTNRRTRSARNERYKNRLSREDEHILSKEAEIINANNYYNRTSPVVRQRTVLLPATNNSHGYSSQQNGMPNIAHRKPPLFGQTPNETNYQRIVNSHNDIYGKIINNGTSDDRKVPPLQRTTPDSYYMPKQKSWSLDNNMNRSSPIVCKENNYNDNFTYYTPPNYPIGAKPLAMHPSESCNYKNPPPPPPRDPQRRVFPIVSNNSYDNFQRPMSYAFENNNQNPNEYKKFPINPSAMTVDRCSSIRSINSINYPPIVNQKLITVPNRSNSDDHIVTSPNFYRNIPVRQSDQLIISQSTVPVPQKRFITRNRNPNDQTKYQIFADQIPRSRKPIHIRPVQNEYCNQYLSDSQVDPRNGYLTNKFIHGNKSSGINSVAQFWKQKEKEEALRKIESRQPKQIYKEHKNEELNSVKKLTSKIESISRDYSETPKSYISPLNTLQITENNSSYRPLSMVNENGENMKQPPTPPTRRSSRQNSASSAEIAEWLGDVENHEKYKNHLQVGESPIPAPRKSLQQNQTNISSSEKSTSATENKKVNSRKSCNLEAALNELEEIYKSLHLADDEDLLDRAERRDIPTFRRTTDEVDNSKERDHSEINKYLSSSTESFTDEKDYTRKSHRSRRSGIPDKVTDDMAYRKLCKNDISPSMSSPKDGMLSQVSYLLASPDPSLAPSPEMINSIPINNREPDITLDDVVYRNLKHVNNTLKVIDPQPPFGIPLGPVTTAPNSDYLHAKPENRTRSRFIPQKIPDIVKDDLAFRSLRKDEVKHPLLPDDYNNNNKILDFQKPLESRRKRAVRSLSANLYHIIQQEENLSREDLQRTPSFLTSMDNEYSNFKRNSSPRQYRSRTVSVDRNNISSDSEIGNNFHHRLRVHIPGDPSSKYDTDIEIRLHRSSSHTPIRTNSQTPTNRTSPEPNLNDLNKSELETLLINLAKETQEESKKLEIELEELNYESPKSISFKNNVKDNKPKKSNLNETLDDIDNVSEHSKICGQILDCLVENAESISSKASDVVKTDEKFETVKDDSLLDKISDIEEVSDHAQLCERLLKCVVESTEAIKAPNEDDSDNETTKETTTNKIADIEKVSEHAQLCEKLLKCVVESVDLTKPQQSPSDIRPGSKNSNTDVEKTPVQHVECVVESVKLVPNQPEKVEITDVEELIDSCVKYAEDLQSMSETAVANELSVIGNETVQPFCKPNNMECSVANVILLRKPDVPNEITLDTVDSDRPSTVKSDECSYLDDLLTSSDISEHYDVDEEKSPFETQKQNILENFAAIKNDLVENPLENETKAGGQEVQQRQATDLKKKENSDLETSVSQGPSNLMRNPPSQCSSTFNDVLSPWYRDFKTMALACAYALACTHQMATLDILTIIGIVLAVISVLAALIV